MRVIRTLPLVVMIACSFPLFAFAADTAPASGWDQVLDRIYSHTWRGRADLSNEIEKQESLIRQRLPDYIASWEQRIAAPAVYVGTKTAEGTCGPLRYCAGDFLDPRAFLGRLRAEKDPVARSIAGKLSPDAREVLLEADLAADDQVGKVVPVLAEEMTRIVRDYSLFSPAGTENEKSVAMSTALQRNTNAAMNRICINKTVIAEAFPAELARNFKCVVQKDDTYRRIVAAKTVQYLREGDRKSLDEAVALGGTFGNKLMYTDFAFWFYYPRALAEIENGNAAAFQFNAYKILNDVVLWEEPLEAGNTSPAEMERRHYAWNLADLVLVRAILEKKVAGLDGLGPAVWVLGSRSEAKAIGEREKALLRFVIDVRKYLSGPESDNYRLNYAVAMSEGSRNYQLLIQALDAGQKGESVQVSFNESIEYLRLANEWAGTWQGKAAAVTASLELMNTGLARMKDLLPQTTLASLAASRDRENLGMALALYQGMVGREADGWEQLRFIDRKVYVDSAQKLWSAMRRNSLLKADYYLEKMDSENFQSVMKNSVPAEKALMRYVNLFESYATADGPREMIPVSAYFAYAEALKRLSRLQRDMYSFSGDMRLHDQSVDFLLKAIRVYPYDDCLSEYATLSRNVNAGSGKTYPDAVVRSIVSNRVVAKCLQGNDSYCDDKTRQALQWNIRKVRNKLYRSSNVTVVGDMKFLLQNLKSGMPAASAAGGGLAGVLKASDGYLALCEEISSLASSAEMQLGRCVADGVGCSEVDAATQRLLSMRGELEKRKTGLVAACTGLLQQRDGTAAGSKPELVENLSNMAVDEYVNQNDRIISLIVRKKSGELAQSDNHPMHKIVKSGYYAFR